MQTNLIIWSKDRACQLHALLSSIQDFWPDQKNLTINVLYTFSNKSFEKGYTLLKSRFWQKVNFIEEESFYKDTMKLINCEEEYIGFSTDDTVLYRKVPYLPKSLYTGECLSLRLGINTILQNHATGEVQAPLNQYSKFAELIAWRTNQYNPQHNYGYPFSLDMHFYRADQLRDIIKFNFKNTNELEGKLTGFRYEIPFMLAFKESCAVNIPVNNMSKMTVAGKEFSYSTETLNDKYLNNYVINLTHIIKQPEKVIGCHQEFPLMLYKFGV